MDPDLALTIGIAVLVLSVPAIVSALTGGRAPRYAAIAILIGGGLVALALSTKPGGYTLDQIPRVVVSVAERYLR